MTRGQGGPPGAVVLDRGPTDSALVSEARHLIRDAVLSAGVEGDPRLASVAELLTDELVTNAVQHGGGCAVLTAAVRDGTLRVCVTDASTELPVVLLPDPVAEHGRGLTIVASLATVWGTRREGDRKSVWFELDLDPGL